MPPAGFSGLAGSSMWPCVFINVYLLMCSLMGKYCSFWHPEPKLVLVLNCCDSTEVNEI